VTGVGLKGQVGGRYRIKDRAYFGLDLNGAADVRVQRRSDSFGGDRRRCGTQPVNDAPKGDLVCAEPDGWVLPPFSGEPRGNEDLGVAELGLKAGVPFGCLHNVLGCLSVKVCGEVTRRVVKAVVGDSWRYSAAFMPAGGSALIARKGVVAISLKAVRSTGSERSNPLGVSTQGRGLSPILRFANIRFVLSQILLRTRSNVVVRWRTLGAKLIL
jgi:hypothetical protein